MSGDFVAALVATSFSDLLVNGAAATDLASASVPASLLIAVYLSLGLYLGCGPSPCERFRLRALGVLVFVTMDLLIATTNGLSVRVLAAAICIGVLVLLLGYYTEAIVRNLLIQWELWGATAVLVGCDARNGKLAERLMAEPQLGLRPVGFLSSHDDTDQRTDLLPLPLLGTMKDMARIGESVEVAIFASRAHLALDEVVCRGRLPFARVFVVEDAQDMQSLWLHTRTLGGAVGIEIRRDLYAPRNLWLKRAIDLLVAVPVGLLVLPLIAALALTIKAVDPGPAFYIQSRVGRDGRLLRILKVRTMYRDAERRLEDHLSQNPSARAEWQRYFKLTDDPRACQPSAALSAAQAWMSYRSCGTWFAETSSGRSAAVPSLSYKQLRSRISDGSGKRAAWPDWSLANLITKRWRLGGTEKHRTCSTFEIGQSGSIFISCYRQYQLS